MRKNVLLSGNDRGGVGKTFNNTQLGDALEAMGYIINYVDGDPGSGSMREIVPHAMILDPKSRDEMDEIFIQISESDADLSIIDLGAGETGKYLTDYFRYRHDIGDYLRFIIGISINSDPESVKCVIPWIEGLSTLGEFIILVSHEKTVPFVMDRVPAGDILLDISSDRVIHFPKLPNELIERYNIKKGRIGDYVTGGKLANSLRLKISSSTSDRWSEYRSEIIEGVYPYAEWLTGRRAPNPPQESIGKKKTDVTGEETRDIILKIKERLAKSRGEIV
jgi:hypothetical protein